ncbi:MAG: SusD/RagB family nutrient-binding outer membrane lipoprotein [Cyclobacteriaceae bacterium]|nr:SusD/RagB family nutrient-binding outer membrane lipoprotein [Cyclobacteriaceae bacterium]
MKNLKYIIGVLLLVAITFNACNTDELTDLNNDPTVASAVDPGYILAYTQLQTSGERYENWRAVLIYQSTMIQHFATLPTYWAGDKYLYIGSYSASLWERAYRNYIKDLVNLIAITDPSVEGQEGLENYHAMARILKVFGMHRLTDHYGDVPYSEAGLGFIERNFFPRYDTQESIYMDMLKELEEAGDQLSASAANPGGQDLFYGGDISQWKKFANSMMLRLGMRMTKVNSGEAQTWVLKALGRGVMENNDDICYIEHTDGPEGINANGIGQVFSVDGSARFSKTFVDWMQSKGDPRLDKLSFVETGGPHQGLPNGYNSTTVLDFDPDYGSGEAYSKMNPLFVTEASPMIFQTYSEVAFLTAEAVERFGYSGNAAEEYTKGVRAAMEMYALYDASLEVADADIVTYLAANPYNAAQWEESLGEQYWAVTFLNEYEAYANWRRTDYPKLIPVDYPGNESKSQIPRRLRYPGSEQAVNPEGYLEAVNRQGEDQFWTRMWWDVAN